jgi:superfamily I DNA/RNA helicase
MEWSSYQRAVFADVETGTGHTVINAVAGSGKTTTIEYAIAHVPRGCRVLFAAFNKSIAVELGRRMSSMKDVNVSTLHSYGLRCIHRNIGYPRIDPDRVRNLYEKAYKIPPFPVHDVEKAVSLAKGHMARTKGQITEISFNFEIQSGIADAGHDSDGDGNGNDDGNGSGNGKTQNRKKSFAEVVLDILERCKSTEDRCIDFDDMVWLPVTLNMPVQKFDRVFIDETQDLNTAQIALALRAVRTGGRICAVGDPRQSIYGFRGADERAFENVKARLSAKELPLSVCYRCSRAVVREAQRIVPGIEAAPGAVDGVVRDAKLGEMLRDVRPGDFVLSRANAPLVSICLKLLAQERPAVVMGRDIGANLASLVKRSKAATVGELLDYIEDWAREEKDRLKHAKKDTPAKVQSIDDRRNAIFALSEGLRNVSDVLDRIDRIFSNVKDSDIITLASTHKAKGLERDRVWMLSETYGRWPGVEEENLTYVAITRAKRELVYVTGVWGKEAAA